jgi:hypothetical protein
VLLKEDVTDEAASWGGRFLLHREVREDNKAAEPDELDLILLLSLAAPPRSPSVEKHGC